MIQMSLFELFIFFFRISTVTFGGGIVILGIVQLEQEKRKDIDPDEFADMVSLAASMPGPIAVSISWLLGHHYKGLAGSIAAVLGAVLPPFLFILFLSPVIMKYSNVHAVQGFFRGVLAGTSAIIAKVIFDHIKTTMSLKLYDVIPFAAVIILIRVFGLHPLISMSAAIAIEILLKEAVR